jgi:hypothetical protein
MIKGTIISTYVLPTIIVIFPFSIVLRLDEIGHRLVTVMQIGQGLVTGGGGRHFGHSLVIYFDVI